MGNTFRTTNRVLHEQVDDARTTTLYGIKSDWAYQPHKNHLLRFGFDIKRQTADYDYYRREQIAGTAIERVYDTIHVATQATNTK